MRRRRWSPPGRRPIGRQAVPPVTSAPPYPGSKIWQQRRRGTIPRNRFGGTLPLSRLQRTLPRNRQAADPSRSPRAERGELRAHPGARPSPLPRSPPRGSVAACPTRRSEAASPGPAEDAAPGSPPATRAAPRRRTAPARPASRANRAGSGSRCDRARRRPVVALRSCSQAVLRLGCPQVVPRPHCLRSLRCRCVRSFPSFCSAFSVDRVGYVLPPR